MPRSLLTLSNLDTPSVVFPLKLDTHLSPLPLSNPLPVKNGQNVKEKRETSPVLNAQVPSLNMESTSPLKINQSPALLPSPPSIQPQTEPAALLPPKSSNNQTENKGTESLIHSPEPRAFSWVNLSCQQKLPKVAVITTDGGEMIDCLSRKEVKRWQKQVKKAGKELLEAMESQADQQDPAQTPPRPPVLTEP